MTASPRGGTLRFGNRKTCVDKAIQREKQIGQHWMTDSVVYGRDVLEILMRLLGNEAYLFVASVCTVWREAWGQRSKTTSRAWAVQSRSCLDWAGASGLDIWDSPCLHAAVEGRLDVLQHAVDLGYSREGMPICEHATGGGHLEVLKWCRSKGYPWGASYVRAAEGGHLRVLKWCKANGCPWIQHPEFGSDLDSRVVPCRVRRTPPRSYRTCTAVIAAAADKGQLEVVRWCREQGCSFPRKMCYLASKGGHLELLKWLRANGCAWSPDTMVGAAKADDIGMLEWCRANGCPFEDNVWRVAASRGNLKMLKWFVANLPRGSRAVLHCTPAAGRGRLRVIQWLRAGGYPWGRNVCYLAASGGHLSTLKWCVESGCPWNEFSNPRPIGGFRGGAKLMVWATSNGCPWISDHWTLSLICDNATQAGNLDLLRWCEARVHTFSSSRIDMMVHGAATLGHVHILQWLRATGRFPEGGNHARLCGAAAVGGSLEVMKLCRAYGLPWDKDTCILAASSGNLELLQWCRRHGCPWDKRTCKMAAMHGDLEMLAWCRANGCPWSGEFLSTVASRQGHVEVEAWCRAHP